MIERIIYQFWTGTNEMSSDRKAALMTDENIDCPVKVLFSDDIQKMELPNHRFHPGYRYLSTVHRSDYLRSYILNFYGGGYMDIKHYSKDNNWKACFDELEHNDRLDVIGTPEIPGGSSIKEYNKSGVTEKLLGNGFFICRPFSDFSTEWYCRVQDYMDSVYDSLVSFGEHEDINNRGPGKEPSGYPIPYFAIQGDIFHPLILETYNNSPSKISNMLRTGLVRYKYR